MDASLSFLVDDNSLVSERLDLGEVPVSTEASPSKSTELTMEDIENTFSNEEIVLDMGFHLPTDMFSFENAQDDILSKPKPVQAVGIQEPPALPVLAEVPQTQSLKRSFCESDSESDEKLNKRPRGSRKSKYNTKPLYVPTNNGKFGKNSTMWQLAAAGLRQKNHTLDANKADIFAIMLDKRNQSREAKLIADKRPLAQESIREFLIENGLPVEDKPFFYRPAMQMAMHMNEVCSGLHSGIPSEVFTDKKKCSDLIGNFAKCINETHGGSLNGLRTMMTKRLPGKAPTAFFFFV